MAARKVEDVDYIQFLIAAQTAFSCVEAAACQPKQTDPAAHDAYTRLLLRQPPDTEALWREVEPLVDRRRGLLVVDDSTLDKPYGKKIELAHWHWSGKHHRVVWGINLQTLLWTDGDALLPCDFRLYDKPADALTKNDHFRQMVKRAQERQFAPSLVAFDSWYSSLENLKAVRAAGWEWLTQFKSNRTVNPDRGGNVALSTLEIPAGGRVVHLRGYGMVRVFRTVSKDGDAEHWATSRLEMTQEERKEWASQAFGIETYHRGIKQCCGVEKCQARKKKAQRGHILLSLRAYVRLEVNYLRQQQTWYAAKKEIIRDAIRDYLATPRYVLSPNSTA
jgi:putative transposase